MSCRGFLPYLMAPDRSGRPLIVSTSIGFVFAILGMESVRENNTSIKHVVAPESSRAEV